MSEVDDDKNVAYRPNSLKSEFTSRFVFFENSKFEVLGGDIQTVIS